jgi:MFS family permease
MFSGSYRTTWIATLFFFAAFYTLNIPVPQYLHSLGLSDVEIGVVLSAFTVAALVGRPLGGYLADRWGSRRVMLLGAGLLLVGSLGMSVSTHIVALFFTRVLQAGGYSIFSTASMTLITLLVPNDRRGQAIAWFGIAANVAIVTIPTLVDALLPGIGLQGAFIMAGGAALLCALVASFLQPIRVAREGGALWPVPTVLWTPMLGAWLSGVGYGAFFQFVPLLAERELQVSAGFAYIPYGLAIILTRVFSGRWQDHANRGTVNALGYLLVTLGLAGYALAGSGWGLAAASVLMAVAMGLLAPGIAALHVDRLPSQRGRAVALYYLSFDLGIGIGAWMLGLLLEWSGFGGMYLGAALLLALGIPLAWVHHRRRVTAYPVSHTSFAAAPAGD